MFDDNEDEELSYTEIDYTFTFDESDDPKVIVLRFDSNIPVNQDEYFTLLREFITHMETLINFKDSAGHLN